jgi:RNA polymerase sigma-70 factor (ECF subfamily)
MVQHPDYPNIHQDYIDGLKSGDRKAQFEIYRLYYRSMYNTCIRIVGVDEDAEDIMQEAFLAAYSKIGTYSGKVSFGAWLKKIVINKSLDVLKSRRQALVSFEDAGPEPGQEERIDNTDYEGITMDIIRDAIQSLPDGYRIVLSLYLVEGYDHEEIAEILGISGSTSRSQYTRARQKLAELLQAMTRKNKH